MHLAEASSSIPIECKRWFDKSKVKAGKDCSLDCSMLSTDMSTFDCSRFCDDLCESRPTEDQDFGFKLSSIYPGLTDAERKYADKHPKAALKGYWLSWRAESICKDLYFKSDTNDESDACRHFMWAALMSSELGATTASEILDAHEQNDSQPEQERAMDLANNRRALIVGADLIKSKKTSEQDFLSQFKEDLKAGRLIVLKGKRK